MQLERYITWAQGLNRWNSDFLIREETKIREVCIEAGERVLKYKEKIERLQSRHEQVGS